MSYPWQSFPSGAQPAVPSFLTGDSDGFALRDMISGPMDAAFAPVLVYEAGVDYANPRWPDLDDLLEGEGLFEGCVQLMCERVASDGARMLVVLPAEDAPEGQYRVQAGETRALTMLFNAVWRSAAGCHAGIEVFELTGFLRPGDGADVNAYRLTAVVDAWLGGRALPVARAA